MKIVFSLFALLLMVAILFISPVGESVAQTAQLIISPKPVSILAFGDLMLDRVVREQIDANGPMYPFEKIAPLLEGHDLIIANAEGVFGEYVSVSVSNYSTLLFTFSTSTLPVLKQLGFTDFSQANNHALNFGWSGLVLSKLAIASVGIHSIGDPDNVDPGPLVESVRGQKIALVGYDQFSASTSDASVLNAIGEAHTQGAFTIVYPHWGEEYNVGTTSLQEKEAHKFINAGADAVVGSHPHVIEPFEIYKGKAIFYSLGNFIFDQPATTTSRGLSIEISLTNKEVSYTLLPFSIVEEQAVPDAMPGEHFVLQR